MKVVYSELGATSERVQRQGITDINFVDTRDYDRARAEGRVRLNSRIFFKRQG